MNNTIIIGEIGECFNGDIETAKRMIREIKNAGCNIVKFQILDMDEVAFDDPEREWFQKLELMPEKLRLLMEYAKHEQIEILFTPVSVKTASWMRQLGCKKVKIASSFLRKEKLLSYINEHFEEVYISTGMAELQEIHQVVNQLNKVKHVSILHCISEYPTGPLLEKRGLKALEEKEAHLNMITMLKKEFPQFVVGYSDHTAGIFVPVIASAIGAEIIEKHVTLDRRTPIEHFNKHLEYLGTDHVLSVEPDELKEMVQLIRRVEQIKGNNIWERSTGEKILIEFLRGRYKKDNKKEML